MHIPASLLKSIQKQWSLQDLQKHGHASEPVTASQSLSLVHYIKQLIEQQLDNSVPTKLAPDGM